MSNEVPEKKQPSEAAPEKKVIPIEKDSLVSAATGGSLFAASKAIHPRSIKGRFTNWRWIFVWLTQIVFYGLPWLNWGERQAVLFDLGVRKFYIFGLVLYPQDFIYLTGILVISALSLFLFTAVAGRLWCGYTCPQTVYTEIFLWFEAKIEGDRSARMRLDKSGWTGEKILKRGGKHLIWLAIALWTGLTFVGYFSPIRELIGNFVHWNLGNWETFWIFFYGFATYGNAGFMREQVCKYMCPYARFQSAMFDPDTLIVTYDENRGEPRGPRSKKADRSSIALGDCIDCTMCVQVCPTGIDIRKGLQYECIGCGACVDACDEVMDKVGYPRGLIKYSTENAMKNNWGKNEIWNRIKRPRILVYTGILVLIAAALVTSLSMRKPMRVDIIRDRGVMSRIVDGGKIENVYLVRVMNTTESEQNYEIRVNGLPGAVVAEGGEMTIGPAQVEQHVVSVRVPFGTIEPGSHPIYLDIRETGSNAQVTEKAAFLVPK